MSRLKDVYFIVDANAKIGMGHLKRCLLLANEFYKHDVKSYFLFSNTTETAKKSIPSTYLTQDFSTIEDLLNHLPNNFPNLEESLLIIDSDIPLLYDNSTQDLILDLGIKFMYITIKNVPFKSHYLLNQNIMALDTNYDVASYTKTFLGPNYFIFDDNLQAIKPNIKTEKDKQNLLITFGGADPGNITERVLSFINVDRFNKIRVVIGDLVPNKDNIVNHPIIKQHLDVFEIHINTKRMYELMRDTDVAITAMGLTFWELALHHVPCLVISGSEREKSQLNYFCKQGFAHFIGNFDDKSWETQWSDNIFNYFNSPSATGVNDLYQKINVNGKTTVVEEIINTFKH